MSAEQANADRERDVVNIDIVALIKKILKEWKTILIFVFVFFCFSFFHISFGPEDYESTSVLIQESEAGGSSVNISGGNLLDIISGSSTSTTGIAAAATGQTPPPLFLYPSIVNSSEFQNRLIHQEVEFEQLDETVSLFEYFTEYAESSVRDKVYTFLTNYTIKLPVTILKGAKSLLRGVLNFFRKLVTNPTGSAEPGPESGRTAGQVSQITDDRLSGYSERELGIMDAMRTRITLEIESGLITVLVRLPDPKASALINAVLLEQIEEYLTDYRVEKARRNLAFIEEQYELAKKRYEESQQALAEYQDKNINLATERSQAQLENLRNIRNIRYNVYNSLAREVEGARLNVQKETPVFQILDKPSIPTEAFTGFDDLMLIFSMILGLFAGVFYVLLKKPVSQFIKKVRPSGGRIVRDSA